MKTLDYIYIAPNGKVDPHNFEIVQERLEQGWQLLTIDNGIAYLRRIAEYPGLDKIIENTPHRVATHKPLIDAIGQPLKQD